MCFYKTAAVATLLKKKSVASVSLSNQIHTGNYFRIFNSAKSCSGVFFHNVRGSLILQRVYHLNFDAIVKTSIVHSCS